MLKIKEIFLRLFAGPWIAAESIEDDDERSFGFLANDIARRTGIFPGIVKSELDNMMSAHNPLVLRFNDLAQERQCRGGDKDFDELCDLIKKRILLRFTDGPQ